MRMGSPKAWLRYENETLLERIIRINLEAEATQILLVVGAENDSPKYPGLLSQSAVNRKLPHKITQKISICIGSPLETPIDSIRHGLAALAEPTRLLLWPIDCPFATGTLVGEMAATFNPEEDHITRPSQGSRHGHPVLFGVPATKELQSPLADRGANQVVRHRSDRVINVPHADPKIFATLNTPSQAVQLGIQLP